MHSQPYPTSPATSAAPTPLPADASPPRSARGPRKLHRRFAPVVFAFYMAGIMAFLMCCVIVGAHSGIDAGYAQRVFKAYALAMPVAFGCVMLVRPVVGKLVAATVHL